mmetsp:Transcript_10677/g.29656  ORF Transcript_10677/g.29656 Transcript_10677/m.29656 type:complete len:207 (+) Transcript_10677:924-1544(+)
MPTWAHSSCERGAVRSSRPRQPRWSRRTWWSWRTRLTIRATRSHFLCEELLVVAAQHVVFLKPLVSQSAPKLLLFVRRHLAVAISEPVESISEAFHIHVTIYTDSIWRTTSRHVDSIVRLRRRVYQICAVVIVQPGRTVSRSAILKPLRQCESLGIPLPPHVRVSVPPVGRDRLLCDHAHGPPVHAETSRCDFQPESGPSIQWKST